MMHPKVSRIDLSQVLDRFPAEAELIDRLLKHDATFLGICEDYSLAAATLSRLAASPAAARRAQVAEYQSIVSDLEREIEAALNNAR